MSLTLYYLLDCLYCNLHRKIFWAFFCLHGKSSTSTAWKNENHRCVLCVRGVCPAISFSYSASAPKLLAAGFGLLLALNMSRRSVWVHLVREECSKKKPVTWCTDHVSGQGAGLRSPTYVCRQTCSRPVSAVAPLSSPGCFGVMVFPWNLHGPMFSFLYPTAKGAEAFFLCCRKPDPTFICWCVSRCVPGRRCRDAVTA